MHIKLVSFLRLIVNSCIAELDLFKLTCKTLMFLPFPRDSGIVGARRGWLQQLILDNDGCLPGEDGRGEHAGFGAAADRDPVGVLHDDGVEDGYLAGSLFVGQAVAHLLSFLF